MAGNYGGNSAPRPTTILDERKLNLTAAPIQKGAKPPSLKVGTYRNNPQFTVFPNCDNGSGVARISAGMNVDTFWMAMNFVQYLSRDDVAPDTIFIGNQEPIKKEERTDPNVRQRVKSETVIGKDEDGQVWISVLDRINGNAPKVKFYFKPDYYHTVRSKADKADKGWVSRQAAFAWAEKYKALVANVLAAQGLDPQNAGGGSGGGYQNKGSSGNGGGGYQGKPSYSNNSGNSGGGAASSGGFDDGDFGDDF